MSDTLLRFTPSVPVEVAYPQGSIVVCRECGKPIYRLQRSIYANEPAGDKSLWKYAPVTPADLKVLAEREDLEPGQRAAIKAMTPQEIAAHCDRIETPKNGLGADCPACKKQFCTGFIPKGSDAPSQFGCKDFKIYLHIIPPPGQSRRAS